MPEFKVHADFEPMGDQPKAIETLAEGIKQGKRAQTLMGVTGSGKTFTMAKLIEKVEDIKKLLGDIDTEGKSSFGTGGIKTKIRAAEIVNGMGIAMVLLNGKKRDIIKDAAEGSARGTLFQK